MQVRRRPLFLVLTGLALALLAACYDDSVIITDPDGDVSFQTVVLTQQSGIDVARTEVIDDRGEWEDVWDEIDRGGAPPAVDFGRDMLVLVAAGERPNGCYSIEITRVRLRNGVVEVDADENQPGTGCTCPSVIVNPVHVIRLPRTSRRVDFDVRRVTQSCR